MQLSKFDLIFKSSGESFDTSIEFKSKRDSSEPKFLVTRVIVVCDSESIFKSLVLWDNEEIGEFVFEFNKSASFGNFELLREKKMI